MLLTLVLLFLLPVFSNGACFTKFRKKRYARQNFGTARLNNDNILLMGGTNRLSDTREITLFNTKAMNFHNMDFYLLTYQIHFYRLELLN